MKVKELLVPVEIISSFADLIAELEVSCEIMGTTDDNEIIVDVEYDGTSRQAIYALQDLIEEYNGGDEDED